MNKHLLYKHIVFCCFVCLALFSCENHDYASSADLVEEAQVLMESDPQKAFEKLEAITDTANMQTADYMRYIVALVYTKQEAKQNIKNDTFIYSAQKYFNLTDDYQQAALANFGAGWVYYQNDDVENAVRSFLHANGNAQKTGNDLLAGRSLNNIGYIYFEQDVMDSAIVYYSKALSHYQKVHNADLRVMRTTYSLGSAYYVDGKYDLALNTYENGLEIADRLTNKEYQSIFKYHKGVVYRKLKNYTTSLMLFQEALTQTTQTDDSIRIYLGLSKLYNDKRQIDSCNYYIGFVKSRLLEITDNYMLQSVYSLFSDYYEQTGNHGEAAKYLKLEKEVRAHIEAKNRADEVQAANHKYYMQQQRKRFEASEQEQNIYLLLLSGTVVVILALFSLFIYFLRRRFPKLDDDYETLWRGYMRSADQTSIDYGKWTTHMLLQHRQSSDHAPDGDTLFEKTIWEVENMLLRNGLYSRKQYLEWAKGYFSVYPEVYKITGGLTNEQLILFAMCINGFTESQKVKALSVPKERLEIYHNELELALARAKYLSPIHIQMMLYYEE